MLFSTKEIPEPTFFNKFKHDYWKKITSSEGLEAVMDISALSTTTSECEAEETLRAIIRKRKEVHQLKKIAFVWIVEINGENSHIETVMKHYFLNRLLEETFKIKSNKFFDFASNTRFFLLRNGMKIFQTSFKGHLFSARCSSYG